MRLDIVEYKTGAYGKVTAYCLGGAVSLATLAPDAYAFRTEVGDPEEFLVGTHATVLTRQREPYEFHASLPPQVARCPHLYAVEEPVRYIQRLDTAKEHRNKGLATELLRHIEQDDLTYGIVQKVNPHHDFVVRAHQRTGYETIFVMPDRDMSLYPFTLLLRDARKRIRPAA